MNQNQRNKIDETTIFLVNLKQHERGGILTQTIKTFIWILGVKTHTFLFKVNFQHPSALFRNNLLVVNFKLFQLLIHYNDIFIMLCAQSELLNENSPDWIPFKRNFLAENHETLSKDFLAHLNFLSVYLWLYYKFKFTIVRMIWKHKRREYVLVIFWLCKSVICCFNFFEYHFNASLFNYNFRFIP